MYSTQVEKEENSATWQDTWIEHITLCDTSQAQKGKYIILFISELWKVKMHIRFTKS